MLRIEVIMMDGTFYELDEWLRLLEKNESRQLSEGARWWLSRIANKEVEIDALS